jgi:hypothetical protein
VSFGAGALPMFSVTDGLRYLYSTAYVEFFDSRVSTVNCRRYARSLIVFQIQAAVSAHDTLQNEPLDGSRLRIKFEWDQGEDAKVE